MHEGARQPATSRICGAYSDRYDRRFLPAPDEARMAEFTRTVRENSPYNDETSTSGRNTAQAAAFSRTQGHASPIEHVIYIIKENRTYDQVLGDLPKGNGDASLSFIR